MPQQNLNQTNFTAGVLSPRLLGRTDVAKYQNGLENSINILTMVHGGATRRPGTYWVAEGKDSTKALRLWPFEYSTLQAYMLEIGNQYIRFYRNRSQLISGTPVEVVTPYLEADLAQLTFCQSADVLYIFHPNYKTRKLTRTSLTAFSISTVDFINGPWRTLNATATTITASAITGAGITLTASTGIFTTQHVGAMFRLKDPQGTPPEAPWQNGVALATTGNLRRWNGRVYSNATTGTTGNTAPTHTQGIVSDGGISWQYLHDGAGWVEITGYTSSTQVTATVRSRLPNGCTSATTYWQESAFSNYRGWPKVGAFYQERLWLGGNNSEPQTLWASTVGGYEDHTPGEGNGTVADDDAIVVTISDDRVNTISWMSAGNALLIGTTSGEFALGPANSNGAVTPSNISVKRQTTHGSAQNVPAIRAGHSVLFVQRSGRKIREMGYSLDIDGYQSPDMTLLSEHITGNGITEQALQEEPDSINWLRRADGWIVGMTYDRAQDVVAFHPHRIGGNYLGGNAIVESLGCIPSPDGKQNDLWLCVKRTIGGVTKRYIEYITDAFNPDRLTHGQEDAIFADAALQYLPASPAANLIPSGTTGSATFTADAVVFYSGDVGKIIRMNGGKARIIAYISGVEVVATIERDLSSTAAAASGDWSIGTETLTFSGLGHLEGQTVQIWADGSVRPERVVTAGQITIEAPAASIAAIGLACPWYMKTLRPEAGAAMGTAQGQQKRTFEISMLLYNTLGVSVRGSEGKNYNPVPFRKTTDAMTALVPMFTGWKKVNPPTGWTPDGQLELAGSDPSPFTILSLVQGLTTSA